MASCGQCFAGLWHRMRHGKPKDDVPGVPPEQTAQPQTKDMEERKNAGSLWEEAYDKVRKRENGADILDAYEQILSDYLKKNFPNTPGNDGNITTDHPGDGERRWKMMSLVVTAGLGKTEKAAKIKDNMSTVTDAVTKANGVIASVVSFYPPAAAAWAGLSVLLGVVNGALAEGTKSRDNVIYMSSRVEWYGSVADVLLLDGFTDQVVDSQRNQLVGLVTALYEELIFYQAKCVCYYARRQGSVIFRDALGLDRWDEALAAVQSAEQSINTRVADLRLTDIQSKLGGIAKTAEAQEQLLRDQLEVQKQIVGHLAASASTQRAWRKEDIEDRKREGKEKKQRRCNKLISKFRLPELNYDRFMEIIPDQAQDTCQWFFENPLYEQWRGASNGLLLLSAAPGQGKSVLAKAMVQSMRNEMPVCYFFFKRDGEEMQKTIANALCAFLSQLFEVDEDYVWAAETQIDQGGGNLTTSAGRLWDVLTTVISAVKPKTVTCIIDALDECSKKERETLLKLLKPLQKDAGSAKFENLKMFVTTRPQELITDFFEELRVPIVTLVDSQSVKRLQEEVDMEIDRRTKNLGTRNKWSSLLQDDMNKALKSRGPQLTYLWAHLIFELLESQRNLPDERWLGIVKSLPEKAIDVYEHLLGQINKHSRPDVERLLLIMVAAERPLNLAEMNVALYISMKRQAPAKEGRQGFMDDNEKLQEWITSNCGFFVQANPSSGKVQFIHQTATEFLLRKDADRREGGGVDTWSPSVVLELAHREVAEICLQYLASDVFSSDLETKPAPWVERNQFRDYAISLWMVHGSKASRNIEDVMRADVMRQLFLPKVTEKGRRWLRNYAEVTQDYDLPDDEDNKLSPLHIAAMTGIRPFVDEVLVKWSVDVNIKTSGNETALFWAVNSGHEGIIRLLVDHEADVNAETRTGETALHKASWKGHKEVVQYLLEHGAEVNVKTKSGETPLSLVVSGRHTHIVPLLLMYQADTNAKNEMGDAILFQAVAYRLVETTRLLLDYGAEVNVKTKFEEETPLFLAASNSFEDIVDLLLRYKADANLQDKTGATALHEVVLNGDVSLTKRLLEGGANANLQDKTGATALYWAAKSRKEELLDLILNQGGVNVNLTTETGESPLYWAARNGMTRALQRLLERGADAQMQTKTGETALYWIAVQSCDEENVL